MPGVLKLYSNILILIVYALGIYLPSTHALAYDQTPTQLPPEIHTPVQLPPADQLKPKEEIKPIEAKPIEPVKPIETQKPATPPPASGGGWHKAPCGVGANNKRAEIQAAVNQLGLSADWTYIDYIFGHESTWDPGCENAGGCRGLGQACPGTKLPCGPADVTCQVQWFHGYAMRAHGGTWASNYAFWLANSWW